MSNLDKYKARIETLHKKLLRMPQEYEMQKSLTMTIGLLYLTDNLVTDTNKKISVEIICDEALTSLENDIKEFTSSNEVKS